MLQNGSARALGQLEMTVRDMAVGRCKSLERSATPEDIEEFQRELSRFSLICQTAADNLPLWPIRADDKLCEQARVHRNYAGQRIPIESSVFSLARLIADLADELDRRLCVLELLHDNYELELAQRLERSADLH
jgi:hypothetical protein